MKLIEWASVHIDYLNSYKKDLLEKKVCETEIICKYKHGVVKYLVEDKLNREVLKKLKEGVIIVICLNSKKNLVFLIERWDVFIKNPKLKIMFVNQKLNQNWSVIPYIHTKITEPKALKPGLKSLFNSISSV